jgi:hypothetical protein
MHRKSWKKPQLIVLVRTLPEDGVLQAQACKFRGLDGPQTDGCIPPPAGQLEGCVDYVIS